MQKDLERRLVFSLFYIGAAIALLFAAQVFADTNNAAATSVQRISASWLRQLA